MEKVEKEKMIKRLRRIEGQVRGIQTMLENDRECPDILIEISAVKSALDAVSKIIAQNYTYECVKVDPGNEEKLESLLRAIFKYH